MKQYLVSTAPGTSSPRNPKLGAVREVMSSYIDAQRAAGGHARVTLHGIHIYVNGEPYPISRIKQMTRELERRTRGPQ